MSLAPLESSTSTRTPLVFIFVALAALVIIGGTLALGLYTPAAPTAASEKTLDVPAN